MHGKLPTKKGPDLRAPLYLGLSFFPSTSITSEQARQALDALQRAREASDSQVATVAAHHLGLLVLDHGDDLGLPASERLALGRNCLEQMRKVGERQHVDQLTLRLGLLYRRQEQFQAAYQLLDMAQQAPDPQVATTAAHHLGLLVLDYGDILQLPAAERLTQARSLFEQATASPDPQVATTAAFRLGLLVARQS